MLLLQMIKRPGLNGATVQSCCVRDVSCAGHCSATQAQSTVACLWALCTHPEAETRLLHWRVNLRGGLHGFAHWGPLGLWGASLHHFL